MKEKDNLKNKKLSPQKLKEIQDLYNMLWETAFPKLKK